MDTVKRECLAMLRKLIERGFIEVAPLVTRYLVMKE